jgi:hypothetical protein
MATIFTVPMPGTTITLKPGTQTMRGRTLKCERSVIVDYVEVLPNSMALAVRWHGERFLYRITDPNMIEW